MKEIQKSCEIACKRMKECLDNFSEFKTEKEVKDFLEKDLETAFPTIVASGKGASKPHYDGNKELEKGFCVIDFGVKHKGYCSDITRTVYIGKPSKEEKKWYYDLLKEHKRMIKQVKHNSDIRYIEKCFRRRLKEKNKLFVHALSHGLGKEVHDKMNRILKKGDVITVEPGLYEKEKWGIRIEDDIIVGKGVITDVTRELLIFN